MAALAKQLRCFSRRVSEFAKVRRCYGTSQEALKLNSEGVLVEQDSAKEFAIRCMLTTDATEQHAECLADALIAADYRGHFSHGMNRLDMYVHDIESGVCAGDGEPTVSKETVATALVDGHNLLGPVVGTMSMQLAIEKALEVGIGMVVARRSNHYGIAGFYSMQALEHGLLGLSFTNTSPLSVPTRSKEVFVGTNPICMAAPGLHGDSFVLDMATTTASVGKVEMCDRKAVQMPIGWGVDRHGESTTEPEDVLRDGGLMPLGGLEDTAGYKGYGLTMMVELLCGILGDSSYGPHIRKWKDTDRPANLGQCFMAINPSMFAPGFSERLQTFMNTARNLPQVEGQGKVLVAGDPERAHMAMCDKLGGIPYHPNMIVHLNNVAKALRIEPMKTK